MCASCATRVIARGPKCVVDKYTQTHETTVRANFIPFHLFWPLSFDVYSHHDHPARLILWKATSDASIPSFPGSQDSESGRLSLSTIVLINTTLHPQHTSTSTGESRFYFFFWYRMPHWATCRFCSYYS